MQSSVGVRIVAPALFDEEFNLGSWNSGHVALNDKKAHVLLVTLSKRGKTEEHRYLDHWIAIVSGGVGASVDPVATDPTKLVQHDRYHREALFDENADVLWPRIYRVVGPDPAAELRMALRSQETR